MTPRRLTLLLLALVVALALAVALVVSRGGPASRDSSSTAASEGTAASGFDGAAIPPSPPAPDFTLIDEAGHSVSLSGYRGRVVVLAFLYSTCGATCILIAQQIRGALDELRRPVPVLIVSADPTADTPARIDRFLARVSLTGRVRYLTGSPARLDRVWRAYRVHPAAEGRATFDKFAFLLLLDARGHERVLFAPEVLTPEALAHDIGRLGGG